MRFAKLRKDARTPTYATKGSAGLDFWATEKVVKDKYIQYHTGIALEIPPGYVGLLFALSSVTKTDLTLKNAVGVIDSDYRGEIIFRFQEASSYLKKVIDMMTKGVGFALKGDKTELEAYLDELAAEAHEIDSSAIEYEVNDRIGQLVLIPINQTALQEVEEEELSMTERGQGNFGHTDSKVYVKS